MTELKEKQKQEALKRMDLLKLMKDVKNSFSKHGVVYYSERQNPFFDGVLYWCSNKPKFMDIIKEFEEETNYMVYHSQLVHTIYGDMLSLLFVSTHEEEWEQDKKDLMNGEALAYVNGEFGYIGVAPRNGGITRTW